jgi:dipeptide/tripeptide permease
MYKGSPEKKDGAYTIYYMGVNAGAFFGMMLCGYLAEKIGWAYGFGLAGIFMLLGTLQFWLAGPLFGAVGAKPSKTHEVELPLNSAINAQDKEEAATEEKPNPFTLADKILILISSVIGLGYAINDPLFKIAGIDMFSAFKIGDLEGQYTAVLLALTLFLILVINRISRYTKIVRDRMIAFIIFAFFTVFFWLAFEQGASSLIIFARDNVDRMLSDGAATAFNIINLLLTVIPLLIISWVLYLLWKKTFKKIPGSNVVLVVCFVLMWSIVGWMLNKDFNTIAYDVAYKAIKTSVVPKDYNATAVTLKAFKAKMLSGDFTTKVDGKATAITIDSIGVGSNILRLQTSELKASKAKLAEQQQFNTAYLNAILNMQHTEEAIVYYHEGEHVLKQPLSQLYFYIPVTESMPLSPQLTIEETLTSIAEPINLKVGDDVKMIVKDNQGTAYGYLSAERLETTRARGKLLNKDNGVVSAKVTKVKANEVEITVSWFSILNSFFIIVFASFFSKWWDSKYNPSAAAKYALGLILMAVGFGLLALGAHGVLDGVKVGMIWLILAYLFHTLGELCLSPVGLSYVSKLVPPRMIALMFGMWYLAIAIGNKMAAVIGGEIENITKAYSLSTFFLIFTIVPLMAGLLILVLNPLLKRLMHGVR